MASPSTSEPEDAAPRADGGDPLALLKEQRQRRRNLSALPRVLGLALSLVWQADRRGAIRAMSVQAVSAVLLAAQVVLGKYALDALGRTSSSDRFSTGQVLVPVLLLTAASSLTGLFATLQQLQARTLGEHVQRTAWDRILAVTSQVDLITYEDDRFHDQLQRVTSLVILRPLGVAQGLLSVVAGVAGSALLVVALLTIAPILVPLVLLAGIPVYLTTRRAGKIEFDFSLRQTPDARRRLYLRDLLTSRAIAKEVRAFDLAPFLRGRYDRLYDAYLHALQQHVRQRTVFACVGAAMAAVTATACVILLFELLNSGRVGIAGAGVAVLTLRLLAGRVQQVFSGAGALAESGLFLEDLAAFLTREMSGEGRGSTRQPAHPGFETLRLEDVSFRYPGAAREAVRGVSLHLDRGEVVALVGENGSGKTTLAKIIAQLYQPDTGTVTWNGLPMSGESATEARRSVSVLFQDFVHYALPASLNIGVGDPERAADLPAVEEAARLAGIYDVLEALPHGLDTVLSTEFEQGADLSGGQWQRVALARAFFRDAPLVVLDEPTAALDPRAEFELFQRIRDLARGRTVLLISHRFSSVRNADRTYVLRDGAVCESGTHDELMALKGHYQELFSLQASSYLSASPAPRRRARLKDGTS